MCVMTRRTEGGLMPRSSIFNQSFSGRAAHITPLPEVWAAYKADVGTLSHVFLDRCVKRRVKDAGRCKELHTLTPTTFHVAQS